MNTFAAKGVHDGISFIGKFRAAEHGEWKTVQQNGEVARFPSQREAKEAAQAALIAYMNGHYVSERARADYLWSAGTLFRPGKKPILVEAK